MPRIAINGLGRMGKLVLRNLVDTGAGGDLVLVNEPACPPEHLSLLLEFDSVHGRWPVDIKPGPESVTVNGMEIRLAATDRIDELPLSEMAIDVVLDCTGVFRSEAGCAPFFAAGVKKVVVSAPIENETALNLVYGVNHEIYDPAKHRLITAASCTTNCFAPIVKVIHDQLGIKHGVITTIHAVTNTQTIVDRPAKNLRRARSALNSLIPTTTGSATAISLIYPELRGRLNGLAVRVPVLNASLTDCVLEVERPTTVDETNRYLKAAAVGPLKGVLGFEERPLVSADYTNDSRSAIIDGPMTMVVNGTQVKILAWYDNEWAYACRLGDITRMVTESLRTI